MFFSQTRSSRDNMWHEARKQERKIRGMLVDLKKRAERRKEFYERIKQDPAQFLQLHGRRCKIHIDLAIAQAADSPVTMMPWQGNRDIMIDRFDVRAHLDMIPEYKPVAEPPPMTEEQKEEERQTNYERYRTLVQNDFLGVTEDKFLHQIYLEERYGPIGKPVGTTEEEKKKLAEKKAAISYVYEDSTPAPSTSSSNQNDEQQEEEEDKEDLSDIDLDVTVDVNVLTIEQSKEMNDYSHAYGMESTDFISYLHLDKEEQERLKQARELEEEKAMYSGRKSRRERRALREKKLKNRVVTSPPSYAARASPTYKTLRAQSSSRSRSRSPQNAGEITFITSFGDDASDDEDHASKKGLSKGAPSTSGPAASGSSSSGGKASSSRTSGGRQDGSSRRKSRDHSRDRRAGSSHGSGRGGRQLRRRSSTSRSRSSSAGRVRRRSRSRSRNRPSYRAQRGPRRRSRSLRLRSPRHRGGRRSASRSRSRSRSRHRGGYRRRSTSSPRSPPRGGRDRRSKSRSRSRSRSRSSPPRKLPSPPRKSYYRHSLSKSRSKSLSSEDDTGGGGGGGDESKMTTATTRSRSDSSSDESRGPSSVGTANGNRRNWPSADTLRPNISVGKPGPASKGPAGAAGGPLSVREKLKRKMQAALNKQYKADKRAEREKQDKINQERWDRAEELRGMALRLRQREREKRHKERDEYGYDPDESRDGHDGYSSRSGSRSRSRSRSPEPRPPGESPYSGPPPDYPRNSSYNSRRRSRSRSRSPPQDYYRSRPPPSSSWSSSRGLVDY